MVQLSTDQHRQVRPSDLDFVTGNLEVIEQQAEMHEGLLKAPWQDFLGRLVWVYTQTRLEPSPTAVAFLLRKHEINTHD